MKTCFSEPPGQGEGEQVGDVFPGGADRAEESRVEREAQPDARHHRVVYPVEATKAKRES